MKISWGFRILILYSLFVTGILFMVFMAMHQKVDLVSEKYYEKELDYSNKYTRMQNSLNLQNNIIINYDGVKDTMEIIFPKEFEEEKISGEITFYKPDNQSLDFNIPIKLEEGNRQIISTIKVLNGEWTVQINWKGNDTLYYKEQSFLFK